MLNAQAAVELAMRVIEQDVNWRTNYTHGVETTQMNFGNGTLSWKLLDASSPSDGNLADDVADPVEIKGIGRVGDALIVERVVVTDQGVGVEEGPLQVKASGFGGSGWVTVNSTSWVGMYFIPELPGDAVEWKVSSIDFWIAKNGGPSQTLIVNLSEADVNHLPATQIDSVSVPESNLPTAMTWYTVPFSGHAGMPPGQPVCVTLECTSTSNVADVFVDPANVTADAEMLTGGESSPWSADPTSSLHFRVKATYTTAGGVKVTTGTWRRAGYP